LGANNNKEVNSVKKADKPSVVIKIYGDNNKVYLNETRSHVPAVAIGVIIAALVAAAVLAVFFCCPDQLPDFVRSIGEVINS
jgi:ABC-type proline/glycine betaine transport system permease subunit